MTLWLTDTGHHVTGVDLSQVQIQRAMRLVPGAQLISADVTAVAFEARSFDAIICLYTIIHLPLVEQASLLIRIASWLRPGGWLLLTAGDRSWTGSEQRWLDGRAPMWWSHADRST
jgi:2-polyprenyl-3-methyl-5-hydroxy-6-metoxy-1,4-benzoquinol methylase